MRMQYAIYKLHVYHAEIKLPWSSGTPVAGAALTAAPAEASAAAPEAAATPESKPTRAPHS